MLQFIQTDGHSKNWVREGGKGGGIEEEEEEEGRRRMMRRMEEAKKEGVYLVLGLAFLSNIIEKFLRKTTSPGIQGTL